MRRIKFSELWSYVTEPLYETKWTTSKLTDLIDKNQRDLIIRNYHEGKTNYRGIDETESRIIQNSQNINQNTSIQFQKLQIIVWILNWGTTHNFGVI